MDGEAEVVGPAPYIVELVENRVSESVAILPFDSVVQNIEWGNGPMSRIAEEAASQGPLESKRRERRREAAIRLTDLPCLRGGILVLLYYWYSTAVLQV